MTPPGRIARARSTLPSVPAFRGAGARVESRLSRRSILPSYQLHFLDDPSRVDLIDGPEAEVVTTILAAHPTRNMELWQQAKLVRILGPRAAGGTLTAPVRRRG